MQGLALLVQEQLKRGPRAGDLFVAKMAINTRQARTVRRERDYHAA